MHTCTHAGGQQLEKLLASLFLPAAFGFGTDALGDAEYAEVGLIWLWICTCTLCTLCIPWPPCTTRICNHAPYALNAYA